MKPFWKDEKYIVVHSGIPFEKYETVIEEVPLVQLLFNRYDFIKVDRLFLGKYKVVFGHTGFYSPYVDNYKIGIDTAACFLETQPLTAYCTESNMLIDSNGNRKKVDEISRNYCPNIVRVKPWRNNAIS